MSQLQSLDNRTTVEERNKVLSEYMATLMHSGYGQSVRQDILKGVLQRWAQMEEEDRPLYRTREQIQSQKRANKHRHLNTWFLRGGNTVVLNVQATPGGLLAERTRAALKGSSGPDGGTTLAQQREGKGILAEIRRADPFMPLGCPYEDKCSVVETQTCWTSKIMYQLSCTRCPAEYRGKSWHTGHKRCSEHQRALDSGDTRYEITRHYKSQHPD